MRQRGAISIDGNVGCQSCDVVDELYCVLGLRFRDGGWAGLEGPGPRMAGSRSRNCGSSRSRTTRAWGRVHGQVGPMPVPRRSPLSSNDAFNVLPNLR